MKKTISAVIALVAAIIFLRVAIWLVQITISAVFIISGIVLTGLIAIPIYLYLSKKLLK